MDNLCSQTNVQRIERNETKTRKKTMNNAIQEKKNIISHLHHTTAVHRYLLAMKLNIEEKLFRSTTTTTKHAH